MSGWKGEDEDVARIDAERLVNISNDNIPVGRFLGRLKTRWSLFNPLLK